MREPADFFRDDTLRALTNKAIPATAMQFSSGTLFSSSLMTTQSTRPYAADATMNPSTPAMATPSRNPVNCFSSNFSSSTGMTRCLLIDGGGRNNSDLLNRSSLRIDISHNLMNTLTAQVKLVRNLAEGFAGRTHLKNLLISNNVSGRPWTKRSPHPSRDTRELSRSFFRKLIFTKTLPGISNPGPQINSGIFEFFDMSCRHVGVSFTNSKLPKGSDVCFETGGVVHSRDSNTHPESSSGRMIHDKQ